MAIGVKEYAVFCPICTTFASPDQVVAVPSGDPGDLLVAQWAFSVLFLPEMQELSFSGQVLLCFHVKPLFKVGFPRRIKWIGRPLNGSVPVDFHVERAPQMHGLRVPLLVLDFPCEHPVVRALGRVVFLPHPGRPLNAGVSS